MKQWRTNFRKLGPKIVHYKNYKNFKNELFTENLVNQLSVTEINTILVSFSNKPSDERGIRGVMLLPTEIVLWQGDFFWKFALVSFSKTFKNILALTSPESRWGPCQDRWRGIRQARSENNIYIYIYISEE